MCLLLWFLFYRNRISFRTISTFPSHRNCTDTPQMWTIYIPGGKRWAVLTYTKYIIAGYLFNSSTQNAAGSACLVCKKQTLSPCGQTHRGRGEQMFGVFLWVVRWCGCLAPLTYIERWFRFDAKAGDLWKGVDSLGGLGGIGTILLWICVSEFVCVCFYGWAEDASARYFWR